MLRFAPCVFHMVFTTQDEPERANRNVNLFKIKELKSILFEEHQRYDSLFFRKKPLAKPTDANRNVKLFPKASPSTHIPPPKSERPTPQDGYNRPARRNYTKLYSPIGLPRQQ